MTESRTKRSLINISISLINRFVVILLPFAIRTIIIYTIGIEYLGVDSLFASILSMLSLSELGFSSAIVYAMYKPIADGNDQKVRAILCYYKKIYRIIGSIILLLGLILLPNIERFIADGTEVPSDINIYIVYLVFLLNSSVSYLLFGYKSSILIATMRNDIDSMLDMIRSILSHGLQIIVLLLYKKYYLYIIILPVITVLNNVIRSWVVDKRFPHFLGKAILEKDEKRDILIKVGALTGNKLGGVVFTSVDSIVISKYLGLIILAKYTNYYTIFTAVYGIESTIYSSIQSVIGSRLVTESKEKNYELFKNLNLVNSFFSCIGTCCFLSLYQPFISLWVGSDNLLGLEIPVLLSLYFFVKNVRRICFLFKEAAGMWREDFLKPYFSVLLNLTVNIILVNKIGLAGVVISSILALVLIEIPWETIVFFKKYFHKSLREYILDILLSTAICILCVITTYGICQYIAEGVGGIVVRLITIVCTCVLIQLPILLFSKRGRRVAKYILTAFKNMCRTKGVIK